MICFEEQQELIASIRDYVDAQIDQIPSEERRQERRHVLDKVHQELYALGVMGLEETALWRCGTSMTVGILAQLARMDAGLALRVHRQAFLSVMADALPAWPSDASVGCCWHGRYGIGRSGLMTWWQNPAMVPDVLLDVFDGSTPRLVLLHPSQTTVLLPVATPEGFYIYRQDVSRLPSVSHLGLSYLRAVHVAAEHGAQLESLLPVHLAQRSWHREWLALLTIQYGCLLQALERARAFARIRYQGGSFIIDHPAVQQLIGEAEHAVLTMQAFLAQPLDTPVFETTLPKQRPWLEAMMRKGMDGCLQVLGGSGYMLDVGLAMPWQDVHALGQLSGGRFDMLALAAELGR